MTEDTKSPYPSEPAQPSAPLGEAGNETSAPCRCIEIDGYGIDRAACRAADHSDET